jgi:cold shock CspA family protein
MKNLIAGFIVFLALVSGSPALAQSTDRLGEILTDVLGGFLSGRQGVELQTWRGHFVQAKGTTMIFRAEDGKTYAVDMSAIGTQTWHSLALGQPVTLTAKPGSGPQALIAARLEPEQQDRTGRLRETRQFRTAHGTVERVEGSQLTVRTTDGALLPVDVAQMTGEAEFRARDGALVVLEPGPANTVVWIEREDRRDGSRRDILSGLPGEYRRLHGHRVHGSGTTMIFLADDGTTSSVDMSAIGTQAWSSVELGQAVTLAAKPGREPNTLVAERIQADPADRSTGKVPRRPFDSVQGTVEAVQGSQISFRTADGIVLRADASQMPGHAAIRGNERGVLTYERGPRQQVTALWLERAEIQPSAAVGPRTAGPGEYQRIYGYVQSIGWATMSLKADDGRTLAVDTSAVDAQVREIMRPGDLVSVLGKTTARADQFVAESIERQARR